MTELALYIDSSIRELHKYIHGFCAMHKHTYICGRSGEARKYVQGSIYYSKNKIMYSLRPVAIVHNGRGCQDNER